MMSPLASMETELQRPAAKQVGPLRRAQQKIAFAAWFLCLALIARKTALVRPQLETDANLRIDTFAAFEIGLVGLACLLLVSRPQLLAMLRSLGGTSAGWLVALCGLGLLSALWSHQLAYSAFQATEVLSQILLVFLALGYCVGFEEAEERVLTIAMITVALGMSITVRLHGLTFVPRHWHNNSYTASAAMVLCYCVAEYFGANRQRSRRLVGCGTIAAMAVSLGTSSASMVATATGICLATCLIRGARWPLVTLLILLALGAMLNPDAALDVVFPGKEGSQVTTIRGRTDMWQDFAGYVAQRPLLGHGFAVGDRLGGGLATNTHNSFLSVTLGMGFVGLLFFVVMLLRLPLEVLRTTSARCPGAAGAACAMAAGLVNSMSTAYLGEDWRDPSLVFVCFLALHTMVLQRGVLARRVAVAVP